MHSKELNSCTPKQGYMAIDWIELNQGAKRTSSTDPISQIMMVALVTILLCLIALSDAAALPQDFQTSNKWTTTDDGTSVTKPFSEPVKSLSEVGGNPTKPTAEVTSDISTEEVKIGEEVLSANESSTHSAESFSGSSTSEFTQKNTEIEIATESTESLPTQMEGVSEVHTSEAKADETSVVTGKPTLSTPVATETVEDKISTATEPFPQDIRKTYEALFDRLLEYTRTYNFVDKGILALMRNRLNEILKLYNGVNQDLAKEGFLDK
ncbi:unnamed protein product [Rodentolepis nana]|uniref:Flocculation protein FLO11-like n=1 Tax=Rodentolepis nana TaxID=102285 RepID=A0A0R3TGP3_RODNA|nr:unnamed protein product [Rodentolepis nana]